MSNLKLKQPIQFLLKQLEKEENRERFNLVIGNTILRAMHTFKGSIGFVQKSDSCTYSDNFSFLHQFEQEKIIRTCLSRTKETENDDGDAIISVFEGDSPSHLTGGIYRCHKMSDLLGREFDLLLRHSYLLKDAFNQKNYSLDEAIDFLGERMIELVPEYKEFCKNNLN